LASPREIKKRINSVKNTRKITRTMEMVSTAKSKKASNRVNASQPYARKVQELMRSLSSLSSHVESPYLRNPDTIRRVGIFAITGNRGLCGGYNSNVNRLTMKRIQEWKSRGAEVELYVVGKKGAAFFRYQKVSVAKAYTHIDDKSGYREAEEFARFFMERFAREELDVVEIISTIYKSSATQIPGVTPVLPIQPPSSTEKVGLENVLYEPEPQAILESLLPMVVKVSFQRAILEALCSEHIARRIAMKSATDAAGEMIKSLTRGYNRARQSKITQEISEIVGGASSIQ